MTLIQPRRGTAAQWTAANPTLAEGEIGYETDTRREKRGDGVTAWNLLGYNRERGFSFAGLTPTEDLTAVQPLKESDSGPVPVGEPLDFTGVFDAAVTPAIEAAVPPVVAAETASAVPPVVASEVAATVPPAVTADLVSRAPTVEDLGGGSGRISIGGANGPSFPWPANGWSGITGKPTPVLEANNRLRREIRRARPGIVRRVKAPGSNLTEFDSLIRVFYDGHKFFTDFDVTTKRHTGTRWYSDRENGLSTNSGRGTALSAPLAEGSAVTSLSVDALPADFPSGSKVVVAAKDPFGEWHSMVATLSALASTGATTIAVDSVTVNYPYPIGALVANPNNNVFASYAKCVAGDQLVPLDRASNSFGGVLDRSGGWGFGEMNITTAGTTTSALSTGAPITSIPITALGSQINIWSQVTLDDGAGHYQTFTMAATATAGSTSLSVVSQEPNFAYPSGTSVKKGNRLAKSITIAPQFPGEMKLVAGDWHTWALKATYTNVYTVTRSNTQKVVDSGVGEVGMEYTRVADAAACEALPGSYYVSGSEVGVHFIKGGAPDPKRVHVLMTSESFTARNENGDMTLYLEGFKVYGGGKGNLLCTGTGAGNLDIYAYGMDFLWSVGTTSEANSLNINGCRYAFFQNCRAAFSPKDGFNYGGSSGTGVRFIEVDCEAWAHGIGNTIAGSENTNNATTAHQGVKGVRVGGHYHETVGAVLADVQTGTETWNVECDAWGSLSAVNNYNRAIDAQQAGAVMWLYNVRGFDALFDVEARTGTTINVFNSEYDTSTGSGTINTLTAV